VSLCGFLPERNVAVGGDNRAEATVSTSSRLKIARTHSPGVGKRVKYLKSNVNPCKITYNTVETQAQTVAALRD
jgi:hypothetical protein